MSDIPYTTKYATDVITPDNSVVKIKSVDTTPPTDGGGGTTPPPTITCVGAESTASVYHYAHESLLTDPDSDAKLEAIFRSIKVYANGVDVTTYTPDQMKAEFDITLEGSSDVTGAPVLAGYVPLQSMNLTNDSRTNDLRFYCDFSANNADDLLIVCIANNTTADLEGKQTYTCLGYSKVKEISCEGVPDRTPCFSLTGNWDIEVDGITRLTNVTEQDILSAWGLLIIEGPTPPLYAEICNIAAPIQCTPSGGWDFNNTTLNRAIYSDPSVKVVHFICEQTQQEGNPIRTHAKLQVNEEGLLEIVDVINGERNYNWLRAPVGTIGQHVDTLLTTTYIPDVKIQSGPFNYLSIVDREDYCDSQGFKYMFKIALQNIAALTKGRYYVYNSNGNELGYIDFNYVNNTVRLRVNDVQVTPFIFNTPSTQEQAKLVERACLQHFAAEITAATGAVCTIVEEGWQVLPVAFDASHSPAVNSMYLRIDSNESITFIGSKQRTGTANNPEDDNPRYGFEVENVGLLTGSGYGGYSPDWSGPRESSFEGCSGRQLFPDEVSFMTSIKPEQYKGATRWVDAPATFKILTLEEAGITPAAGEVSITDIYNLGDSEQRTIHSCGFYEEMPS